MLWSKLKIDAQRRGTGDPKSGGGGVENAEPYPKSAERKTGEGGMSPDSKGRDVKDIHGKGTSFGKNCHPQGPNEQSGKSGEKVRSNQGK